MQLDIFEHSRDVMLRNDVLQALQQHDAARAHSACKVLQQEYPADEGLPALLALIETVQARNELATAFADHHALSLARLNLLERVLRRMSCEFSLALPILSLAY